MHILYMDESGVEDLKAGTSHFVLLGLAIPATQWKDLDTALYDIKGSYGLRDTEIHSAWMHRRYSEQESIPDFATLDPDARHAAAAPRLTRFTRKFHADGTLCRQVTHMAETPLFVDGGLTSIVQRMRRAWQKGGLEHPGMSSEADSEDRRWLVSLWRGICASGDTA